MKKGFNYIFLILIVLSACSTEETVEPFGKEELPFIWCELSPKDSVVLRLKNVQKSTAKFEQVKLLDEKGNLVANLKQRDSILWTNSYIPKEGRNYQLQFNWNKKRIFVQTNIPKPFLATLSTSEKTDSLAIQLNLENNEVGKSQYIIEVIQKYANNRRFLLRIDCDRKHTDNQRLNELHPPYKRIFIHTEKQIKLNLTIPYQKSENEQIELVVKRVNEDYYNFLYSLELQQQDEENTIQAHSKEFLGVFSGCYPVRFSL